MSAVSEVNTKTNRCVTLDTDPRAQVVVLVDGMGCPTGGKQASETAVSTTIDALRLAGDTAITTPADTIKKWEDHHEQDRR